MITVSGKVIITDNSVEITGFAFDGVTLAEARLEALYWAMEQLRCLEVGLEVADG